MHGAASYGTAAYCKGGVLRLPHDRLDSETRMFLQVDAEILVKDLRRSLRRRVPAQLAPSAPAERAADNATEGGSAPLNGSCACAGQVSDVAASLTKHCAGETERLLQSVSVLLAGNEPFWGWHPPQLRNPFARQQHALSPADQQQVAATMEAHPSVGAQGQPSSGEHIGIPGFLGRHWGKPVEAEAERVEPAPAQPAASSGASEQRGWGLHHLPNPFEGWGRRVVPA